MGNQSFVLGQINTRHNQREKERQREKEKQRRRGPHPLILAVMDSRSKSVGTVLCKLRRHPSMALMIMGRCEWCCGAPGTLPGPCYSSSFQPPLGHFQCDPLDIPVSPPPYCHPYPSTLPHGSSLPPKKGGRKKKNNSQQDICFIYLTNYLSGNVLTVPLIGSQEVDREDSDRDRCWMKEKQEKEVGLRASPVPVLILPLLLIPLFSSELHLPWSLWIGDKAVKWLTVTLFYL